MKINTLIIAAAFLLLLSCVAQEIVDFTLVEFDQRQGKPSRQREIINIKPNPDVIRGFTFPEACYLAKKLEEEKTVNDHEVANYDMDIMIDGLKNDFVDLLKVS